MRLLILTQYFPPEVGAPQNRLYELAVQLAAQGIEVRVLTAMPNYPQMEVYKGYKYSFYKKEVMGPLTVFRSWIFVSKGRGVLARLLNYFSFTISSFIVGLLFAGKADVIMCESPPLFLGITAWLLKKIRSAKLIFNVSDLWPESAEKLGIITNKRLLDQATKLEEFLYRNSELISCQTQGIQQNINARISNAKTYWLPNGVDLSYYDPQKFNRAGNFRKQYKINENDLVFLYAGILGYAQGLDVIIEAAEQLKANMQLKFVLLGSGPEKARLERLVLEKKLANVVFADTVSKTEMPNVLMEVDACIIPLKRLDLFKGAIPSKIFEALAMGKPVLLGVEGEAYYHFVEQGACALPFIPEDAVSLSQAVLRLISESDLRLTLSKNARNYVSQKFDRKNIAYDFSDQIKKLNG